MATDAASYSYLRLRPTTDGLIQGDIGTQLRRLHAISRGTRTRWRRRHRPATTEWLLVSRPDTEGIEYYIGAATDVLDAVEQSCRGLFPDSYEIEPRSVTLPTGTVDGAVEYLGVTERRFDWQTQLTPYHAVEERARVPLASVIEAMASASSPMVYQALVEPLNDFTRESTLRQHLLARGQDRNVWRDVDSLVGYTPTDVSIDEAAQRRIDELAAKDSQHPFTVTARLVAYSIDETEDESATASTPQSTRHTRTLESLTSVFSPVGRTCYQIKGRVRTGRRAARIATALADRVTAPRTYERASTRLTGQHRSRALIVDPAELGSFCLIDGAALTAAGVRAVAPAPGERTTIAEPTDRDIATYDGEGFALGARLTQDGTATTTVSLPPSLQPLHTVWFGKTGSGKTTATMTGMLSNRTATDGAAIIIDGKGDGMPMEYMRSHFATHGSLDNVLYFDCAKVLPALSFFDIRPQMDDGIDRSSAVADVVDHYVELLQALMGTERYDQAIRSPDIIRYLVKALFDPVHGADAFTHRELQAAALAMKETRDPPAVIDADLELMLGGLAASSKRSFDELMQGVANRIEKIPVDDRLGRLFNHINDDGEPTFDLRTYLDEPVVIIFDTGGLRTESQRALTLVLLSNLWTALKRRARTTSADERTLVNLYIEEAADVATTDLLGELLAKARSFGLAVTLSMQFPAQLREASPDAYAEVLNNVSTVVTGNVPNDRQLAERLATTDMDVDEVAARLRALRRGQWLVSLPAQFGDPEPRPFTVASLPLPKGHPDGDEPLSGDHALVFEAFVTLTSERTREVAGLQFIDPRIDALSRDELAAEVAAGEESPYPITSALSLTKRLPGSISYEADGEEIRCRGCETNYPCTSRGLRQALACCQSLDSIERDEIPIVELNFELSARGQELSPYSPSQLAFLQAVHQVRQGVFDPAYEYDLTRDSMVRLQEYTGLEEHERQQLLDDGLVSIDCERPYRIYTLTNEGREQLNITYREGVDYGPGKGDLGESTLHRLMVIVGRRYIEQAFVANPESPVARSVVYYPVGDGRLDAAGLDADDNVIVTLEAERANNDILTGVPADFDKMAACKPDHAIWLVKSRPAGHEVLRALNTPTDGHVRVAQRYGASVPLERFDITEPGFTEIHTLEQLQKRLEA